MSLMELAELLPAEATPRSSSSRASTPAVPLSAVEDLVETVVVLRKDQRSHELGISVVGGSDTYLGCVVVQAVSEGGAAWQDGRLQRGDILLQVNDTSLAVLDPGIALATESNMKNDSMKDVSISVHSTLRLLNNSTQSSNSKSSSKIN
ncbi:multiple PDZ domain protein-like [Penaeus chinensis]|uniref:multiple PDZ domain protein-like n=1 Tax=Penaeus chinensis TaxID=139456 RepID=UPI001FB5AFF6|nr:multiple PDZ domain protein-like [Penaeus chinensis]